MRKHANGSKTMVMLALLAVLLGSLGYLSMQGGREGLCSINNTVNTTKEKCKSVKGTWS